MRRSASRFIVVRSTRRDLCPHVFDPEQRRAPLIGSARVKVCRETAKTPLREGGFCRLTAILNDAMGEISSRRA